MPVPELEMVSDLVLVLVLVLEPVLEFERLPALVPVSM